LYDVQTTNIANEIPRLSSGERMLRANDNAAGIALSENLRTQVISYNQAVRNCQDATSMLRTAEGGLDETGKILSRMRELVVRGASDTNTEADRAKIFQELEALSDDIEIISDRTHFNNIKLLKGGAAETTGFTFAIDLRVEHGINVKVSAADTAALGVQASDLKVDTHANAEKSLKNIDTAIEKVAAIRSRLGAGMESLAHAAASLSVTSNAANSSQSLIRELDTAQESIRLSRDQILSQSSRAMFVQANQIATSVLDLLR
jgi:flagellin